MCLSKDKITPAIDVHHKDSFLNYEGLERLAKAYDSDNLLSVCKECHSFLHRNGTTHGYNGESYWFSITAYLLSITVKNHRYTKRRDRFLDIISFYLIGLQITRKSDEKQCIR